MVLTPENIYKDCKNKNIDRNTAIDLLISLINNSNNDDIRADCILALEKVGVINENTFKFLENLLISDSNGKVRNAAALLIKNKFIEKAFLPMKWGISHESDYDCIITIIKTLVKINSHESKKILVKEVKNIKKMKYIGEDRLNFNKFRKNIKQLFKDKKIKYLTHKQLAEILINYRTISALTRKFYSLFYNLENALVVDLDLSDQLEVRGIPWTWKNNINDISEIIGLKNLKYLRRLALTNNQIKNVKDLINLKKLTHLYLSNNKIEGMDNLEYLKKIPNLKFLDIEGNKIADIINLQDFKQGLKIKISSSYFF
ncbi:MAG: leucine-rich repeat domain-containing protein [Promethearchaeota archaeon]